MIVAALGMLALAAAAAIVWALRRRADEAAEASGSPETPRRFLLELEVPPHREGCAAALAARGHRFPKEEAPPLPLAGCADPARCACRYRSLPERRLVVRRTTPDRRARLRFEPENPPRRSGPGRRNADRASWGWRG